MFFLTLCPIRDDYYFDPVFYWSDVLTFFSVAVFLAIPIGVFVFLWNNFVPNAPDPRSDAVVFSLKDPPVYFAEASPSTWIVALYLLTGIVTFSLGVLAFEVVQSFS